jgi:hypothetical protein
MVYRPERLPRSSCYTGGVIDDMDPEGCTPVSCRRHKLSSPDTQYVPHHVIAFIFILTRHHRHHIKFVRPFDLVMIMETRRVRLGLTSLLYIILT